MKIRLVILIILFALIGVSCDKRDVATIYTDDAFEITSNTAKVKMIIANDGGAVVAVGGICYDTVPKATIYNGLYTMNAWGKGEFTVKLTSLKPAKKYYARGWGTNTIGTSYGNEINFTTLDTVK